MSLSWYGWSPFFDRQAVHAGTEPGRVRLATARKADVFAADRRLRVSLPRNLRNVTVGDWLLFDPRERVATHRLDRFTQISRRRPGSAPREQVLAANADDVVVVVGLDRPVNPRQVERYLLCALGGGSNPVIVLNKADLHRRVADELRALAAIEDRFPIVVTSAETGAGLRDLLRTLTAGGTVALMGPSGVGKSSLVNALIETDHLRVGAVRGSDSRGKHTTTRRELVRHPSGLLLMDIPGIREIYPWSQPSRVDEVFAEIGGLARDCRYRDCRHGDEPDCAVLAGLADGTVSAVRIASYRELRAEQETLARELEASRSQRQ